MSSQHRRGSCEDRISASTDFGVCLQIDSFSSGRMLALECGGDRIIHNVEHLHGAGYGGGIGAWKQQASNFWEGGL